MLYLRFDATASIQKNAAGDSVTGCVFWSYYTIRNLDCLASTASSEPDASHRQTKKCEA